MTPGDDRIWSLLMGRLQGIEEDLKETLKQTRMTNGHVRDHEHRIVDVEDELRENDKQRRQRAAHRFTKLEITVAGLCVLISGAVPEILRLIFS